MDSFMERYCRYSNPPLQALLITGLRLVFVTVLFMQSALFVPLVYGQTGDGALDLSVLEDDNADSSTEIVTESKTQEIVHETPIGNESNVRFFELVKASGWIGVILLILSVIAVTLIIRFCFSLRASSFTPEQLKQDVSQSLIRGDMKAARTIVAASPSYSGCVLTAGLRESYRGWNAIEKAIEDSSSSLAAKYYRTTEPLSLIGNVAPMLGLLGTVMGMVSTFGELAVTDGSGRNLANGIYFALVTTVAGLLVAIPVLVAHSLINARLASLISTANDEIFRLLEPLRQSLSTSVPNGPAPNYSSPRPIHGLQEISSTGETTSSFEQDVKQTRPSGRPSLSLKNRRPDGE